MIDPTIENCPIFNEKIEHKKERDGDYIIFPDSDSKNYFCDYSIYNRMKELPEIEKIKLGYLIIHNKLPFKMIGDYYNSIISKDVLGKLNDFNFPSISEKANLFLEYFAKNFQFGEEIYFFSNIQSGDSWTIRPGNKDHILAYCCLFESNSNKTVVEIISYLQEIKKINFTEQSGRYCFNVSIEGYDYINQKKHIKKDSAFIAMWFGGEDEANQTQQSQLREAIQKGISNAGYEPIIIDQVHHNNKICDEILKNIRQVKFIVADFTSSQDKDDLYIPRGGVYFEAGFALGLNKEVIWTCQEDQAKQIHFDTRQYNQIRWELDKLDDFTKKLQNRIEATIGRGSHER